MNWLASACDNLVHPCNTPASALIFDIGVFALVVGATVLMLIAIAHQSVRGHRATPRTVGTHPAPAKVSALTGED